MATDSGTYDPEPHAEFEKIAQDFLWINALRLRHDVALDNSLVSVDCIREAFQRVYELGRQHGYGDGHDGV